jgi:hypothetical protein
MFKKVAILTGWLAGCYVAGYVGTTVFLKTAAWVTDKLNE